MTPIFNHGFLRSRSGRAQKNGDAAEVLRLDYQLLRKDAEGLSWEYKKFLHSIVVDEEILSSEHMVDQLWYLHLRDDKAWQTYCKAVIGRVPYHFEGRPPAPRDPAYLRSLQVMS